MGKKLLIFILWLLILLSGMSYAQIKPEADLDNFRGMKWGMDISKLPKDEFTQDNLIGDQTLFVKNNEDLNVLGVNAKKIDYTFIDNRFYGVTMRFSLNQKDELKDVLREYLGKPSSG